MSGTKNKLESSNMNQNETNSVFSERLDDFKPNLIPIGDDCRDGFKSKYEKELDDFEGKYSFNF